MSWKITEVIRVGTVTGPDAGKTTRLRVVFPWGEEMVEVAPTLTPEGVRDTLDSIVRDKNISERHRDETPRLSKQLLGLRPKES